MGATRVRLAELGDRRRRVSRTGHPHLASSERDTRAADARVANAVDRLTDPWQASAVLGRLLASDEPSIRWQARTAVLSEQVGTDLPEEIRSSARVAALLSDREDDGSIPFHPYAKWRGAHWVLVVLAELGYPPGDQSLVPLREQVLAWLFSDAYVKRWLPPRHGLCRLHASQEANAICFLLKLQLADDRVEQLVERLLRAQWPDGGWNCDPGQDARVSSFEETL